MNREFKEEYDDHGRLKQDESIEIATVNIEGMQMFVPVQKVRTRAYSGPKLHQTSVLNVHVVPESRRPWWRRLAKWFSRVSVLGLTYDLALLLLLIIGARYQWMGFLFESTEAHGLGVAGDRLSEWGVHRHHPVVLQPGIVTTGLEFWKTAPCAKGLFRSRVWGRSDMVKNVQRDPLCWIKHMQLNAMTGLDPEELFVRSADGQEAADEFIAGFWIWSIIISDQNKIGYDGNIMTIAPYDWRLSYAALDVRDRFFQKLESIVERQFHNNRNRKVVVVMHSMGGLVWQYFINRQEALRPGWVNSFIHAAVHIGTPHQGVAKSVPSQLSGEMRDTAELGGWITFLKQMLLGNTDITAIFRNMHSVMSMGLKGGNLVWGNNTRTIDGHDNVAELAKCHGCAEHHEQMWIDYGFVAELSKHELPRWADMLQHRGFAIVTQITTWLERNVLNSTYVIQQNPWIPLVSERVYQRLVSIYADLIRVPNEYQLVLNVLAKVSTRPLRRTRDKGVVALEAQHLQGIVDQAVVLRDKFFNNVGVQLSPGLPLDTHRVGKSQAYITLTETHVRDRTWASSAAVVKKKLGKKDNSSRYERHHLTSPKLSRPVNVTDWELAVRGGELSENAQKTGFEPLDLNTSCQVNSICSQCRKQPLLKVCNLCECNNASKKSVQKYQYSIDEGLALLNQTAPSHVQRVSSQFSQGIAQTGACPPGMSHRFPAMVHAGSEQIYVCESELNHSGYSKAQDFFMTGQCPRNFTHVFTLGSPILAKYMAQCGYISIPNQESTMPPLLVPVSSPQHIPYPSNGTVSVVGAVASDKYMVTQNKDTRQFYPQSFNPYLAFLEAQRLWSNPLTSSLPVAPNMTIYNLYGVGKPTERRFFYRINPSVTERAYIPFLLDTRMDAPDTAHVSNGIGYVDGDGTVPLLSLGYMCTETGGWSYKALNPVNIPCINREYRSDKKFRGIFRNDAASIDHIDLMGNTRLITDILLIVGRVNMTQFQITEKYYKEQWTKNQHPEAINQEIELLFGGPLPDKHGFVHLQSREHSCIKHMASQIDLKMRKHEHRNIYAHTDTIAEEENRMNTLW